MTQWEYSESGVTLRDQFAMTALRAIPDWMIPATEKHIIAENCYDMADAMMEARETNNGKDKQ